MCVHIFWYDFHSTTTNSIVKINVLHHKTFGRRYVHCASLCATRICHFNASFDVVFVAKICCTLPKVRTIPVGFITARRFMPAAAHIYACQFDMHKLWVS